MIGANRVGAGPDPAGAGEADESTAAYRSPTLTPPKAGGAIRGIGEKFTANPASGSCGLTIPIATTDGRDSFGPQLVLSYDTTVGNGPFGQGFTLSGASISRRSDKGLPRYQDADESDVFVLSDAEDLVPVLRADGTRFVDTTSVPGSVIHRYRPRVEGAFVRVERLTEAATGAVSWRTISRDGITSRYGTDEQSRVADGHAATTRVARWLLRESYDGKGHAMRFEYVAENGRGVDVTAAHEASRSAAARGRHRYLKRIWYGNRVSRLTEPDLDAAQWLFEVVLDYDEAHCVDVPADPVRPRDEQHDYVLAAREAIDDWPVRPDPVSSYRAGFDIRMYRRCRRVLMFHHIPALPSGEPGYDGLVAATEFDYHDLAYPADSLAAELAHPGSTRSGSLLCAVTQVGFVPDSTAPPDPGVDPRYRRYLRRALPPLTLEYSRPVIDDRLHEVDAADLATAPAGIGPPAVLVDLDGDGLTGILQELPGAWHYLPNAGEGRFGAPVTLATRPAGGRIAAGNRLLDLTGRGQVDLVEFRGPTPGYFAREDGEWADFEPFPGLPNLDWHDPNLRFADIDGDGVADVLVTAGDCITWYPSRGRDGYGPGIRVDQPSDETRGPRVLFADPEQSVQVADMSGDGLPDLVRVRNGEVCYWPNLGYGAFGPRVVLDGCPRLDAPDQFAPDRIRLADIDGSGTTDLVYLGRESTVVLFNQCGNRWSRPRKLPAFPVTDSTATAEVLDLLGTGTACLVWSTPLPDPGGSRIRYLDLTGATRPNLLTRVVNNLGAETSVQYRSSTGFYLDDRRAGRPWVTRLPFPVPVVAATQVRDRVSGNVFRTSYRYHHGYYDPVDREFRGFGMVEQVDVAAADTDPDGPPSNTGTGADAPPMYSRTWFHTGAFLGRDRISDYFACLGPAGRGEFYAEPGLSDAARRARRLPDSVLPDDLTPAEQREACRALRGSMIRQEIYDRDAPAPGVAPITVREQNFGVRLLQSRRNQRHAVLLAVPRETLTYQFERGAEARINHTAALAVDDHGNVLLAASVGYGRTRPDAALLEADRLRQVATLATLTEAAFTNVVDTADAYRMPLPSESRVYELTGLPAVSAAGRLSLAALAAAATGAAPLRFDEAPTAGEQKRLLQHTRTYYRADDLASDLPLGVVQSLALPAQALRLALHRQMVAGVFGGRADDADLTAGGYRHDAGDGDWWAPSGRLFYSPGRDDPTATELARARAHFFLPVRFRDPYDTAAVPTESTVSYDEYDLRVQETVDALGNRVTVGERAVDPADPPVRHGLDYRTVQPVLLMDANRNRNECVYDALGMLTATAAMGKPEDVPARGDRITGALVVEPTRAQIAALLAAPVAGAAALLGDATSRTVYDVHAYWRSGRAPAVTVTLDRDNVHAAEPVPAAGLRIRIGVAFTDGFGRQIQRKVLAEPGPAPERDALGHIVIGADGRPAPGAAVATRWLCSGWQVFNTKSNPVREFEPFFTELAGFEPDTRVGVTAVRCYDAGSRLIARLSPDHTFEKTVFGAWSHELWDRSDTVLIDDPADDPDVGGWFGHLDPAEFRPTWHALRTDPALAAARWPDARDQAAQVRAARGAEVHAATPSTLHVDALGRGIAVTERNVARYSGSPATAEVLRSGTVLDIKGNHVADRDATGRLIATAGYDLLGACLVRTGLDAGPRWTLADVTGNPLRGWDSNGTATRTRYDALRRPVEWLVATAGGAEIVVGRNVYGDTASATPEERNQRGKVVQIQDQAGVVGQPDWDFKGNKLVSSRQLAAEFATVLDWSAGPALATETFTGATSFDARNRPIQTVAPHSDQTAGGYYVTQLGYGVGGLLDTVDVWDGLAARPDGALDPGTATIHAVTGIDYDELGHRTRIGHGNSVVTTLRYEPATWRLANLTTRRDPATFPGDTAAPAGWPGMQVQNLRYTYDPMGNPTSIRDDAQQAVFFRNKRVEPTAEYTYDALYQLIEATGREHLGQPAGGPLPFGPDDGPRIRPAPGDGRAMATYLERYAYDAAGSLTRIAHRGTDPADPGWTRTFADTEASRLEPGRTGNRLTSSEIADTVEVFSIAGDGYDANGNALRLPNLPQLQWDHADRLRMAQRQVVNGGGGERTWFVYGADGGRVRKVRVDAAGQPVSERVYLGGLEIFRTLSGAALTRESLHINDDDGRIALLETRTAGADPSAARLLRYQHGDHMRSVRIELDENAALLSYAEYTPYGSTAYQGVHTATQTSSRYRFAARERDEETGLYYVGARYYAPWLGRWLSTDPEGTADHPNAYAYCRGNPIRLTDRDGRDGETEQPSNWNRFLGGLKMIGGAVEMVAGGTLIVGGVVTAETGVGAAVGIGGGILVGGHGIDTVQSGARTLWTGREVDSGTSEVLQSAGMSRTSANLTDAGIGIVGSLGAGALAKTPAIAGVAAETSITVSHAAGAPSALGLTNPLGYAIGHTRVGVTIVDEAGQTSTVWSHLIVPEAPNRVMMLGGTLVKSGDAVIVTGDVAPRFASLATVPLTTEQAMAARAFMQSSAGNAGAYGLFVNDCASYGGQVFNAAGVSASGVTPSTLWLSAALRSGTPVSTIMTAPLVVRPVAATGATISFVNGVGSLTYSHTPAGPLTSTTPAGTNSSTFVIQSTPLPQSGGLPDPHAFTTFDQFVSAASAGYSQDYLMQQWANVHGWRSGP